MDNIGKMYNADGRRPSSSSQKGAMGSSFSTPSYSSAYGRSSGRESYSRQIPSHTESFYRTLREASKDTSVPDKKEPALSEHEELRSAGGILSALGLSGSPSLGSLGGSISSGLSSLLKKIGDDDILLLLMIVILLNENKQDDYLILIILGVILLT